MWQRVPTDEADAAAPAPVTARGKSARTLRVPPILVPAGDTLRAFVAALSPHRSTSPHFLSSAPDAPASPTPDEIHSARLSQGPAWTDFEVEPSAATAVGPALHARRVYMSTALAAREAAALEHLNSRTASDWAPQLADRSGAARGVLVIERPRNAMLLSSAREAFSRARLLALLVHGLGGALLEMRELGILHTSLCPLSLLVLPGEERDRLLICDWATAARRAGADPGRSQALTTLWAPPEQSRGIVPAETDAFAWAGLLYWAVTGRPPLQPRAPCGEACARSEPGTDELEETLLHRALMPDPRQRHCDIRDMLPVAREWLAKHYASKPRL